MGNFDLVRGNLEKARDFFAAKMAFTVGAHDLDIVSQQKPADAVIVDVRYRKDFLAGHVPGAINLPKGTWEKPRGVRKDATHYLYCYNQSCHLAAEAALELARQGYKVVEVEGGWDTYVGMGFARESVQAAA